MSRRSVPPISRADLRDHADEARIGRIWDRLEHDLTGLEVAPSRGRGITLVLVAAAFAAFAGGLFAGKVVWQGGAPSSIPTVATSDRPGMDVFAAGSEARTFSLPGGGQLRLEAGSTVEIEHAEAGSLTLRLVQGVASIDTATGPDAAAVAILAGEARLSTRAGSVVRVERRVDNVDVTVKNGFVSVVSPDGKDELKQDPNVKTFRTTRPISAAVTPTAERRIPPIVASVALPATAEPVAVLAAPQGWYALYSKDQLEAATTLLTQQGFDNAINAAQSGAELSAIATCAGKNKVVANRAYERVLASFPKDSYYADIAASALSKAYAKSDPERSRKLLEQATAAKSVVGEDALCRSLRGATNKDEATRLANEYVSQYPNGACKDEVERILHGDDDAEGVDPAPTPNKGEAPKP